METNPDSYVNVSSYHKSTDESTSKRKEISPDIIKSNFIFNTSSTILMALFPILTIPFVARILGPDGVGKVSFVGSIVSFFVILASLGIPTYGLREIARVRNNQEKLNEVFSELFLINLASTIIFSAFYIIFIIVIEGIVDNFYLFLIMGFILFSNLFQIQWLYQGLEDYKFVAISNFIVYIGAIILIYLSITSKDNYILYGAILTIPTLFLGLFFITHSRKYAKLKLTRNISIFHLKGTFWLYFLTIITNMYVYFDRAILGFLAGDTAVGLYTIADQLIKFATLIVTSLGVVLIPRFSYYFKNNNTKQFQQIAYFSLNFVYLLSLPAITGMFFLAPEIIFIFSGKQYAASIILLQIMVPVILFIGITNFIGNQILIPSGEDKKVLMSAIVGLIASLTLSFLLIPKFQQLGTAIATFSAELMVLIVQVILGRKYLSHNLITKHIIYYISGSLLIIIIITLTKYFFSSSLLIIAISVPISAIIYFGFLLLAKEEITLRIFKIITVLLKSRNISFLFN